MKIPLTEIPNEAKYIDIKEKASLFNEKLKSIKLNAKIDNAFILVGEGDLAFEDTITGTLEILRQKSMIKIKGQITAHIRQDCSRCLVDVKSTINKKLDLMYLIKNESEKKEITLTKEETGYDFVDGEDIDLFSIIIEQVLLDADFKPLCKDDCKGICPKCGVDLNIGTCNCKLDDKTDLRLSKLKDFKAK